MIGTFSNREISAAIWIFILLVFLATKKNIRLAIKNVLQSFLNLKILIPIFVFIICISILIYLFLLTPIWTVEILKNSIIWIIFSGLPNAFKIATINNAKQYWNELIIENIKLLVIIEFIISAYTFSLLVEIIVFPFIMFIALLNAYAQSVKELKKLKKATDILFSIVGIAILAYTIYRIVIDFENFASLNTLTNFLLPIILTAYSVPFLYLLRVFTLYEQVFIRLKFGEKRTKKLNTFIKFRLLLFCNVLTKRLILVANMNNYNIIQITNKADVYEMIRIYRDILRRRGKD